MQNCVICDKGGEKVILVTDRGKSSLKEFSKLRQNEEVLYLLEQNEEIHVHEKCRKWYNNKKRIESEHRKLNETKQSPSLETKTSTESFHWGSDCQIETTKCPLLKNCH